MYRYCPRCGSSLAVTKHDGQHVPICQNSECGFIFWQNAKPCASVLIPDGKGRVCMAIRAIHPDKGKLDLPGGFLHEDEHPDDGAKREIREELGVDISIEGYLGFAVDRYEETGTYSYYTLIVCAIGRITKGVPQPTDDIAGIEWVDPATVSPGRLAFTNNKTFLDLWVRRNTQG